MSDIQVFKNFVVSFFFIILFSKRPDPIKCPVRTNAHPIAFVFKQVPRVLNWSITVLTCPHLIIYGSTVSLLNYARMEFQETY